MGAAEDDGRDGGNAGRADGRPDAVEDRGHVDALGDGALADAYCGIVHAQQGCTRFPLQDCASEHIRHLTTECRDVALAYLECAVAMSPLVGCSNENGAPLPRDGCLSEFETFTTCLREADVPYWTS
jgi:hypothetical protein